ncbi:hypothetical protein PN402_04960, partial [Pediococcus acidilactici]|nr:hypothetical protein [Pediococcus acidilactici]
SRRKLLSLFVVGTSMIPEFFVLVFFFYHFGCVANLIIKRAINKSPYFIKKFIAENQLLPTVNMGLIIGTRAILLEFLGIILKLITEASLKIQQGNKDAGLGKYDMEVGNYVAYRYFADRLVHGREVSTILQGFQSVSSAWFKHK